MALDKEKEEFELQKTEKAKSERGNSDERKTKLEEINKHGSPHSLRAKSSEKSFSGRT
jgi:hypothetical protein